MDPRDTEVSLRAAGCVAADEEAHELHAFVGTDERLLRELVARRCTGEPLAWLVGSVRFCDEVVRVSPGVYVPRWQSEPLTRAAIARLPESGLAVDFCTGSGALALVMARRRPLARVVATESEPLAIECARSNGVEVYEGDMIENLPREIYGRVDVITAVVPYVPTDELSRLPRDVIEWEPLIALDGGEDGTRYLVQAINDAATLLRAGGSLLLELGGDQAALVQPVLAELGFRESELLVDDDGESRGLLSVR